MLAALFAVTALAYAGTAPPAPPPHVRVTRCDAYRAPAPYADTYTNDKGKIRTRYHKRGQDLLYISYVNDGARPLSEITFAFVVKGWMVAAAQDTGVFSNGALIEHSFPVSDQIFPLGTEFPHCVVLSVRYADGSVWTNPLPPKQ